MCGVLAILFIAVPALEIYTLILVGTEIGPLATLGVIVATGVLGAALARHQGFQAVREVQKALISGSRVGRVMVEAALVLTASVLLLTPGFFTDAFGFGLLLPPIRRWVAEIIVARFAARVTRVAMSGVSEFSAVGSPWQRRPPRHPPRHPDDVAAGGHSGETDEREPPPPSVIDV